MSSQAKTGSSDAESVELPVCEFCGFILGTHEQCPARDKGECVA